MEALAAVSLASNIIQFVDFSTKLIHGAREIYVSVSGDTEENKSVESITSELKSLTSKLSSPATSQQTEDEKSLSRLAGECKIVADQILNLLNKIKPKDPQSRRQIAWSSLKNMLHTREKAELEARLQNCRTQLGLQLTFLMSTETKNKLDSLIRSAKGDNITLGLLQQHVEHLSRGVTLTSIGPEAEKRLREILHLSEEAYDKTSQMHILNSLSFDDMYGRFEAVDKAHSKTFEWVFEETCKDQDDEPDDHESFVHWLSSGKGIFHILGKLGSGKSTLMKFVCTRERTKAELRKWAGDRNLVFATFFFWKPGSPLQRSLSGLFRSLLHDTLTACPELIPKVLPHQWTQARSMPGQSQPRIHLSTQDIRDAFSRLIEFRNAYKKHCFCFFIDGLDEYENTRQEDYRDMVKVLIKWTETAPEDVKICVSSREYNVFLSSFSDRRRLRLQDLTRGDMECYVRDRLRTTEKGVETNIEPLVQAVVEKASGIFLWVALVVRSLRERLGDGYKLATLERELGVLPDELEDLFRYLLRSVNKSARLMAYQTFAIILKSKTYEIDLSLDWYYFLEDYEADTEFAMKPSFGVSGLSAIERCDIAQKKLNGCCKGLVEPTEHRGSSTIAFTHRSVPEFLEQEETRRDMDFHLQKFSPEDALSQLFLAELRLAHLGRGGIDQSSAYLIIRMLFQSQVERPPYRWREFLHCTLHEFEGSIDQGTLWTGWSGQVLNTDTNSVVTSPLSISAFLGDYEYVARKLALDSTIIDTDMKKSWLLGWTALGAVSESHLGCFRLLHLFLKQEGISPQTVLHTEPLIIKPCPDVELTIWQTFIIRSAFEYIPEHDTGSLTGRVSNYGREYHHCFGAIIEEFLRLGADPHLWIWVPDEPRSKVIQQTPAGYRGGYQHPEDCEVIFGRERTKIVYTAQIAIETLEFIDRKGGHVTFRDLILFWGLDNTETLLELTDKMLQSPEGSAMEPTSTEEEEVVKAPEEDLRQLWHWFELLLQQSQFAIFLLGIIFAVILLRLWPTGV